jgi:NADPH-dependent ferric siderophore reductase
VDFAVHEAGPATRWALATRPGDQLAIGGPKGSMVVADDFDFYLLVGDESALPSIGRRAESLRAGVPVTTVVVIDGPDDVQQFETKAGWTPIWVFRNGEQTDDGALLRQALTKSWLTPEGEGYVWIAAEAKVARHLRDYMLIDRGQPKNWLKASGYWARGQAGVSDKLER